MLRSDYSRPIANLIALGLLSLSLSVKAGTLEASLGAYQFNATNSNNGAKNSLAGFGAYHVAYHNPIWSHFEADAGYSIIATNGFGGDLAFGFDIGINYFPFTENTDIKFKTPIASGVFGSVWRPFIGLGFHQRNFQSTSSQYAGAGLKIGAEYEWKQSMSLIGYARYISLGGPNQSQANQTELLFGALYHLW